MYAILQWIQDIAKEHFGKKKSTEAILKLVFGRKAILSNTKSSFFLNDVIEVKNLY